MLASLLMAAAAAFAPASADGTWVFDLGGYYQDGASLGNFTDRFKATSDGNRIFFESSSSKYNIVALLQDDGSLLFEKTSVTPPNPDFEYINVLCQVPFVNTSGAADIEDLTEQEFSAEYDPQSGVIKFPEGAGLLYGYFSASTGDFKFWEDAFNLLGARKAASEDLSSIEIGEIKAARADGELIVNYEYTMTNIPASCVIYSYLCDADGNLLKMDEASGSPGTIRLAKVSEGVLDLSLRLKAVDYSNGMKYDSEPKYFTVGATGIDRVEFSSGDEDVASSRYYNLLGQRRARPGKGIFIRVEGDRAVKVIR